MEILYLIKCNEYFKIGIATDLQSRLAQLQTGNPYTLVVEACFEFPNALVVEKALHQRFAGVRKLGEWFELGEKGVSDFVTLCQMLGGVELMEEVPANESQIEEAEEVQEAIVEHGETWDYSKRLRDGWRMEPSSSRGASDKYWAWRRGIDKEREYIYGGRIVDLPYPSLEEMRRIFRDGKLYQPYIKETLS